MRRDDKWGLLVRERGKEGRQEGRQAGRLGWGRGEVGRQSVYTKS